MNCFSTRPRRCALRSCILVSVILSNIQLCSCGMYCGRPYRVRAASPPPTCIPGCTSSRWTSFAKPVGCHSASSLDTYSRTWITMAAFGCNIGLIDTKEQASSELCDAFRLVSASVTRLTLWPMLRFFFPILRIFVRRHLFHPAHTLTICTYLDVSPSSRLGACSTRAGSWATSRRSS